MKALSRAIDRFCIRHRHFGVPRLMLYVVGINAAVYLISMMDTTGLFLRYFIFSPHYILRGEVWRLVTWAFIPSGGGMLGTLLTLYFYYFVGTTLEQVWGTPKFTIYYIFGVLFNIIYGLLAWLIFSANVFLTPIYLNLSMFFAFAALFPDQIVRLFFIIPIKIKWLALIDAVVFLYFIVMNIIIRDYFSALLPIVALLNFFLLCGSNLSEFMRTFFRPLRARGSRRVIEFKRAAKKARREYENKPYRHKCAVCGKTDTDNPGLEFRYCSRCEGFHCYCAEHINSHIHFK